jgi:hypothetical protein
MSSSTRIAVGVLIGLIGGSACATYGWRKIVAEYEQDLQMSVESPSLLNAGAQVEVELQIHNRGPRMLDACLGPSRGVSVLSDNRTGGDGRSAFGGSASLVDHPGCQRRFTLEPGGHLAWKESVGVPNVVAGPAVLMVQIQVVSPHHCDRYGCYDTVLTASTRATIR